MNLDEENEINNAEKNDDIPFKENEPLEAKNKTSRLLESNEWSSDNSSVENNSDNSKDIIPAKLESNSTISELISKNLSMSTMDYHAISNLKAYYENNKIENIELFEAQNIDMDIIKSIIKELSIYNPDSLSDDKKYLWGNILRERGSVSDSDTSSVYEKIIREIRSGNNVHIYSPSEENLVFSPKASESEKTNIIVDEESVLVDRPEKQVIIITKKVKEGEPIPPLPVWWEPPKRPDPSDSESIARYEGDMKVIKKLVRKFPFLPEHHESIASSKEYKKQEKEKFKDSLVDWDKEDSMNIEELFEEKSNKDK